VKPAGAIEFSVPMDLSDASYDEAIALLRIDLFEKEKEAEKQIPYSHIFNYKLTVSLWDLDEAVRIMAKYRNCDLVVKRAYGIDEWSLEASTFTHSSVIWSQGA
jgi:hypothetical protein